MANNTTPEGREANKAAYAQLAPALEAWRRSIMGKAESMTTCKHTFTRNHSGVFVCAKCGQTAKLADKED